MHTPWETGKRLVELGYQYTSVQVYRAIPQTAKAFRPGDYLTLSLRFAQEHAVTSAVYEGEPFVVVTVMLPAFEVVGADNPGEYKYQGGQSFNRVKVRNLADESGVPWDAQGKSERYISYQAMLINRVISQYHTP